MLTEIYIEALLVDEELADQVQAALMAGEIDEGLAFLMWLLITRTLSGQGRPYLLRSNHTNNVVRV